MNYSGVDTAGLVVAGEGYSDALRRAARILAFVFFTGIGAQLAVRLPFTPVPVTMQTLFVVLAGVTLGPRDGFYAMLSYIALGASGVPLFAGFSFGPGVLVGITGGYLIAFPAAALLAGSISRMLKDSRAAVLCGALAGLALILVSGTLYISLISGSPPARAASLAAYPFLGGEAVKAFLAVVIAGRRR